jgi:hypothetical protein
MNTLKIALAAALLIVAVAPSFAGGNDDHDPLAVSQKMMATDAAPPLHATGTGGQNQSGGQGQSR